MRGGIHAVVVSAGADVSALGPELAPDLVIAADAGLHAAVACGWAVDLVVGDLDSVRDDVLAAAVARGATVERHAAAKDATDLELALDAAVRRAATRITVVDGRRGRLDHLLATILLVAHPRYAGVELRALVDDAMITVVPAGARRRLRGAVASTVTLLPVGGDATVWTCGLRYALDGEVLGAGSTRGVSNEIVADGVPAGGETARVATVEVHAGVVLAIQPGAVVRP